MMKLIRMVALTAMMALSAAAVSAQTTPATPTGPTSNVDILYVACADRGVVNFTGQMQAGYDIFYQLFGGVGGTGTALSGLRQASVNGSYAYSESVTYSGGTVAAGQVGSVFVSIARETNSSSTIFTTTVNDLQDGCAEPQNPVGTGTEVSDGTTIDPATGTPVDTTPAVQVLSPFGGVVNPGYVPSSAPTVVIGPRDFTIPRHETPGLIFAECNDFPSTFPGLVYDTDRVVLFWSWFAKTAELVQEHIDNANYEVGYFGSNPFMQPVVRTPIQQIGRDWWVFYYIVLGSVRPDEYRFGYSVTWDNPISDGYGDFGPGTANERLSSSCDFTVQPNPQGIAPEYSFP